MRLVVDTSILIAGLLKASKVQRLLLDPAMKFYLPEHALEEVSRHPHLDDGPSLEVSRILARG